MPYQFARERLNYAAFASGQVLHSLPGRPAFPARLASEIYQRSVALLPASAGPPYVLYDPCCGGAQLLTTLAYLHGETIAALIGSDIDADAVHLAARNLALVTLPGLDMRSTALAALAAQYGKPAHREALAHTVELRERLVELTQQRTITASVFQADALNAASVQAGLAGATVDLVIADVPYGQQTAWATSACGAYARPTTGVAAPGGAPPGARGPRRRRHCHRQGATRAARRLPAARPVANRQTPGHDGLVA